MKPIPEKIKTPYVSFLKKQKISSQEIPYYLKWLKYYLDFCEKYSHPTSSSNSLPHFKNKLKQKKQTGRSQNINPVPYFYLAETNFKHCFSGKFMLIYDSFTILLILVSLYLNKHQLVFDKNKSHLVIRFL